jgi:hypothetical protein
MFTELLEMEVSDTEVAVIVTCWLPGGTAEGAVKMLAAPLCVWSGLNEVVPQDGAGAQLQVTPAFLGSSVTVATTFAVAPTAMVAGAVVITISRPVELLLLPPPHAALPTAQSATRTIKRFPRFIVA